MKRTCILLIFITVSFVVKVSAQDCTTLGQNPGTSFPVCGTQEFKQNEVKICGNRKVPTPCDYQDITDKNPYWYKFTCFNSGSLGFLITPADLGDDYDWQLFDITGHKPEDIYTNKSLFVACNWSGEYGETGASGAGSSLTVCEGSGKPLFSSMPNIIRDHEYLLLVSHFTESQSGYTLSFKGGTADITDPKVPMMENATASCDGKEIYIKLNKQMKCASLAADGSDFSLPSGQANIIGAMSQKCNEGFATDVIVLTLDHVLASGDYMVSLITGTDGNTLLDNCQNPMPEGSIRVRVNENVSAAFTYQVTEGCSKDVFTFSHDGANHVNSWNWQFDQSAANTQNTVMEYASGGNKNVRLIVSNDYCTDTASEVITVGEKMNALISGPEIICSADNAIFTDNSTGNMSSWHWDFGNGSTSNMKDPQPFKYSANGAEKTYKVTLNISNALGCTVSATADVVVVSNCNIAVPSAFTPNNDGRNDYLFPSNGFIADNLIFKVYNRFGQIIFETRDWQRKWDGNVNGQPQGSGTYVWSLSYSLRSSGRKYNIKGATVLIR